MAVAARVAERAAVLRETQESGEDGIEEPALGALYSASIIGRIATGPNAGRPVKTLGQITAAKDSGEDDCFQSGSLRCAGWIDGQGFRIGGSGMRSLQRAATDSCRHSSAGKHAEDSQIPRPADPRSTP